MELISVDVTKCVKCDLCAEVCPMRVIGISAEGFPETKKDAFRLCINCGYCVDICIKAALTHIVRRRTADSAAAIRRYEAAVKRYERCKKEQKVEGKLK